MYLTMRDYQRNMYVTFADGNMIKRKDIHKVVLHFYDKKTYLIYLERKKNNG